MRKINFQPGSLPIITLVNDITEARRGGLDLQPEYQRNYIWGDDFKEKLILSIAKRYPIGNFIIRKLDTPNIKGSRQEVVDGQQRLTTIYNFIMNDLEIGYNVSNEIIRENEEIFSNDESREVKKIYTKYLQGKKFKLSYKNIPDGLKRIIDAFPLAVTSISDATNEQVSEYFRFVQNQERLRAGEIINSLPESVLEKYLSQIEDKENILKVINFPDSRMEFDKIFYSIIGLVDKKLNFGVTDSVIRNYVADKTDDLKNDSLKSVNLIVEGLNKISKLSNLSISTNKRLLKFLFLLLAFDLIDTNNIESQLYKLNDINNKLSAFNSAKKDIVENTFRGETKETIEKYRNLALITKGAHPYDRIFQRTKILNELLNS